MSRKINPEKSSNSRSMRNRGSVPIPSLRLSQLLDQVPSKPPVKVKLLVSEQPTRPQTAHPVNILVSEQLADQPDLPDRRQVKVLIADQKPFWQRPLHQSMTKARPQRTGSWKVNLLVTTLLLSAIVGVGGGGFLAAQFIFNPGALSWLPGNKPSEAEHSAQTLKEIQAEAYKAGVFTGSPLYVSTYPGFQKGALGQDDFLLPIYASSMLEKLTELRVYRQVKIVERTVFELKDRIAIAGPSEAEAIAPLTASAQLIQGSDRLLTLSEVDFVEGKAPAAGIWLQVSGEWARSGSQVVYGRVLHYDPLRSRFHTLLTWTSPAGELPRWQQITGSSQTELLVNQSVGLEPHFQVYQMKARKSMAEALQLEAIALTKPALSDRTYENALLLAQNGLWASAQRLLESIKLELVKQNNSWSATAQAQLDLVKLHAQATKVQADRTWASPTQQILALLLDGRWTKALSQLKTAHQNGHDIINFLHANVDHLLPKVETSLIVNPGEADVLRWGTLMKAIESNNRDAVIWLQKHQASADIQQVLALLNLPPDSISITRNVDQPKPSPQISTKVAEKTPAPARSEPPRLHPPLDSSPLPPLAPSPTELQAPAPAEVQPVMESSPIEIQTPSASPETPNQEDQSPVDPKRSEF